MKKKLGSTVTSQYKGLKISPALSAAAQTAPKSSQAFENNNKKKEQFDERKGDSDESRSSRTLKFRIIFGFQKREN